MPPPWSPLPSRIARWLGAILLAGLLVRLDAAVVFAKPVASGDGSGSSWAQASTFASALRVVQAGDQVWLMAGTYTPGASPSATFSIPDGVAVYGGFHGIESDPTQRPGDMGLTVLSGEIGTTTSDNNTVTVVHLNGSGQLNGLTITRAATTALYVGTSTILERVRITHSHGCAIYALTSRSIEMRSCEITDIVNTTPAAILSLNSQSVKMSNCVIADNHMPDPINEPYCIISLGAFNPDPIAHPYLHRLENCLFTLNHGRVVWVNNNTANPIYQEMNRVIFINCTFFGNNYDFRPPIDSVQAGALPPWFYGKAFNCIVHNTGGDEMPLVGERNWEWSALGDPGFVDPSNPAGPDGIWGTADDGLRLRSGAAATGYGRMDVGVADGVAPLAAVDLLGVPRPQGDQPEPGAYEIDAGAGNTTPTATSIAVATREDTPIAILLAGSDRESPVLAVRIASPPAAGTLFPTIDQATPSGPALATGDVVPGNWVLYQPPADATGDGLGAFTFTVDDGTLTSTPALVWIDVQAVNDPPTLDQPGALSVNENSGFQSITLTGISAGPGEVQGLTVSAVSSNPALIPDPLISYASPATTARLAFSPAVAAHGTATITVSVQDDGGTALGGIDRINRSFVITVVHHAAAPVLAVNSGITVDAGQTVTIGPEQLLLTDTDLPDPATLVFVLHDAPLHGTLRRSGTILGTADTFSQLDIAGGFVTYQQDASSEPGSFTVTWRDGTPTSVPDLGPAVVAIRLRGSHRPVITLPPAAGTWTEGTPALAAAAAAQVSDPDALPWDGGGLTALLISGVHEGDALSLAADGNGLGEIDVDGVTVSYSGRVIGTWSGGDGDQPLVVQFTGSDASTTAVQAVARALRFRNSGRNPGADARILRLVVNDGSTGASAPVSSSIAVIPVDDPPALLTTQVASPAGVVRELTLAASDPDSPTLTWAVASPPAGADLTVLDAGTGRFRLAPHPGATGSSTAAIAISDSHNTVTETLTLRLIGADDQRPAPAMEAPLEAFIGQDWTFDLPFVGTDGASLDFTASIDAPTDLILTRLDATSVRVAWRVPDDAEAGRHLSFQIIASTADGSAAGCLPVTVLVRRPLQGSN